MLKSSCPYGGDTENSCADCVYSIDYYYDDVEQECRRREEE